MKFSFFRMTFFKFELDRLEELFPRGKATLEDDFEDDELEAMDNLGVLKGSPHLYLGK